MAKCWSSLPRSSDASVAGSLETARRFLANGFSAEGKLVFCLYDWKCTNLYYPDEWAPAELWAFECPYPLHVGSREPATEQDAREFAEWLVMTTNSASSKVD